MPHTTTYANRHDLVILGQVDSDHIELDVLETGLERHGEVLVEHGVEASGALAVVVAVDSGLLDHGIQ